MRRTVLTRLVLVTLAAAAMSGCAEDGTTPRSSPLSEQVEDSTRKLDCYSRFNGFEDCDGDGVVNSADVIPRRADLGDDDGDSVANKLDRYPSFDDRTFDIDNDGIADFQDTFFGNNNEDVDGDGLLNGYDLQPYAAPPGGTAVSPPPGITNMELANDLLLTQMGRRYSAELLGPKPDGDLDGIPDDIDTSPTKFTNDRDGDGDNDFYDPEPGDPYVDLRNDPYDPRNDEYWED